MTPEDDPTDNVFKLKLVTVGEGFRFDPDALLEAAKGRGFGRVVIIADFKDKDDIWISGSANAGESLILMELAKLQLIKGG